MADPKKKINNKVNVTVTKKDNLGLSPSETRDLKKKQNLGRTKNKMAPSAKIKGEKESDLKRLEQIKKNQAAEDAAKKKKAVGKNKSSGAGGQSVLKTGIRKNKQYIGKKLNKGGTVKGVR